MTGQPDLEVGLTQAYAATHERLEAWLQAAFPRLKDQAADILQNAFIELLQRIRTQNWHPQQDWLSLLRQLARQRAIDYLRSWEQRVFRQLEATKSQAETSEGSSSGPSHPPAAEPTPDSQVVGAERRTRQGLLLSEILSEFCCWCEARTSRLAVREAYERALCGQRPADIARNMGVSPAQVYSLLHQAREWIYQRIRQRDVNRSVFLTLFRVKGEASEDALFAPTTEVAQPISWAEAQSSTGLAPSEAAPPAPQVSIRLPHFATLTDVVRWVIEELGAMCPAPARLEMYRVNPTARELRDVRFHVEEAGCKICRGELSPDANPRR